MTSYRITLTTGEVLTKDDPEEDPLIDIHKAMRDRDMLKWSKYRSEYRIDTICINTVYINPYHIVKVEEEWP
ncbi:TPA_asm: hypothetical protein vir335_00093 [Classicovirus victor]|uniref:Uncharacterized protein n=1 Tax=Caudoviricetes sp. vir335 TaxID=3068357 RepID=A0AA87CDE6_9CAUD|nr:TPA_asm: hypothetical protein vir335_00093 [Caudoviricetes sp. vir335]